MSGPRQIQRHSWVDPYYPGTSLSHDELKLCRRFDCGLPREAEVHWLLASNDPPPDPHGVVVIGYLLFAVVFVIGLVIGCAVGAAWL